MGSSIKWLLALGIGVAGGWALRSLSDTPEGAGVKLLEMGIRAKNRLSSWAAIERERLDDMLAEAQSNISPQSGTAGDSGRAQRPPRREGRTGKRESAQSKTTKSTITGLNS